MSVALAATSSSARCARRARKCSLEQQVLGRIAGDASSGNSDELAPASRARSRQSRDLGRVAVDVADAGFDLGQRDAQRAAMLELSRSRYGARPSQNSANWRSAGSSADGDPQQVAPGERDDARRARRGARITAWPACTERGVERARLVLGQRPQPGGGAAFRRTARRCPAPSA